MNKQKRGSRLRTRGILLMTLGMVMIAGALSLFIYNRQIAHQADELSKRVEERLLDEMEDVDPGYNTGMPDEDGTPNMPADGSMSADGNMQTITIGAYDYIGTLEIPRFGLELPVMENWSYEGLRIAPGRYAGSAWTNDLVIAAHNYDRHFGQIRNLNRGDTVIFIDVLGNVFTYEVTEVTTLGPYAVEEMLSGDWDLTLFTCTYGGQTRVTVRCALVSRSR